MGSVGRRRSRCASRRAVSSMSSTLRRSMQRSAALPTRRHRTSPSVTTARGCTWPTSPASSSRVLAGSVGTVTAPRAARASQHRTYAGVVRAVTTTGPRAHPGVAEPLNRAGPRARTRREGQRAFVGPEPGAPRVAGDSGGEQARDRLGHDCFAGARPVVLHGTSIPCRKVVLTPLRHPAIIKER